MRDKDLDKKKYKPEEAEADYIKQYIANYMNNDPRPLSTEEREKLVQEAEEMQKQQAELRKREQLNETKAA